MRIIIIAFLILTAAGSVYCSTGNSTDPVLTANANALINEYHVTYEVRSETDIRKTTIYRATVLSQGGRSYGRVSTLVDNRSKISSFSGSILKADGSLHSRIKLSDLKDAPSYPDFVFASDSRRYYYEPVIQDYPYTLAYEEVISYSGLIAFESWMPVNSLNLACDTASYTIICPDTYKIRHKSFNISEEPQTLRLEGNRLRISWGVGKIHAVELDNYIPSPETFLPYLMAMPVKFSYDGYNGEVTDARTYGSWVASLLEGRDAVKPDIATRMASLTSDASSTREKVSRVYRYLQENTRYVAITYGIGGLQPAPADKVSQYGYGDCKGLSNYMKSLLASIGIKSYYTEIGNGSRKIKYDDFVYLQTNHVILCVPDQNDTIWLECTSQHYNAGYLGYSNSNRKAMLVTEEGGKIVNTPAADSSNSFRRTRYELEVRPDGSAAYKINTVATGHYYEELLHLKYSTRDEAIRYLYSDLPFRNHSIASYNVSPDTIRLAALTAVIDGNLNKYGTVAGKKLIVPLIAAKMFAYVPKLEPGRKAAINISEHTASTDTIAIKIPDGYKAAVINETKEFSNEFGRYRQSVVSDGYSLLVIRDVLIPAGNFPVENREKVTEFFKKSHDIEAMSIMCEQVQ
jgi:transglutaminase-like putative cysteine protease